VVAHGKQLIAQLLGAGGALGAGKLVQRQVAQGERARGGQLVGGGALEATGKGGVWELSQLVQRQVAQEEGDRRGQLVGRSALQEREKNLQLVATGAGPEV